MPARGRRRCWRPPPAAASTSAALADRTADRIAAVDGFVATPTAATAGRRPRSTTCAWRRSTCWPAEGRGARRSRPRCGTWASPTAWWQRASRPTRRHRRSTSTTTPASRADRLVGAADVTGGGEGMVVKPLDAIATGAHGLVQPAVKCRGPEYLRIIYGPEYRSPANLERLRQRDLGSKRSLALREFALGVEALERFVAGEPLHRCTSASSACSPSRASPSTPGSDRPRSSGPGRGPRAPPQRLRAGRSAGHAHQVLPGVDPAVAQAGDVRAGTRTTATPAGHGRCASGSSMRLSRASRSSARSSSMPTRAGPVLAVVLLDVLEQHDVLALVEHLVEEVAQRARLLGERHQEVVPQSLVQQRPFDDLGVAADVVVAARHDARHRSRGHVAEEAAPRPRRARRPARR